MENTEILVLTGIICTLFALFIIGPLFYAHQLNQNQPNADGSFSSVSKKKAPDYSKMYNAINSDPTLTKKEKSAVTKIMNRTMSDMESDGVYFPEGPKSETSSDSNETPSTKN